MKNLLARMRARWDKRVNVLILFIGLIFFVDFGLTMQGQSKEYWRYFLSRCPAQTSVDGSGSVIPRRCVKQYTDENPKKAAKPGIVDPKIDSTGVYPSFVNEQNPIGKWALVRGPIVFGGLFIFYLAVTWIILAVARTHLVRFLTFFSVVAGHLVATTSWIGTSSGIGGYLFRNIPDDSMIPKEVFYFGIDVLYYMILALLLGLVMCRYISYFRRGSGSKG